MSSNTTVKEERVIEMRFDNKQFETNVKQTMSTIDRLKSALKFTSSSKALSELDKASKNMSFDGVAASIKVLEDRFSTLGIVGMRVIENLTDSIMRKLGSAVNFVSDSIISGGIRRAMNIENAHFQLQALLKDEEKVQAVMDDAMMSVDGTAYAYDEAAKAASQFAASGLQAGEDMQSALRGIVGVAAMTNSEYEGIARIFTTVAGNGRLMGDQLLQLSSRGLNAASTIAEFVNGVNDGSKQTTENVKKAVKEISGGLKVTEGDIREFVSDGKISFEIFSAAMTEAFADSAERANETFTGAFSNMKSALARIGAGFISPIVAQNSEAVELFNALRVKINEVKAALVFDQSIGNVNALSKQFTDSVLSMAKSSAKFISEADLSKPILIFYHWVEILKNSAKGLWSVIKPIGGAFEESFSDFTIDNVIRLTYKIQDLTKGLKLSDKNSKNLKDTFKGLLSIIKFVAGGFMDLIRIIVPIGKPVGSLTEQFLSLTGALGRNATAFTEWVNQSETVYKAYKLIQDGFNYAMSGISKFINKIGDVISKTKQLPSVKRAINDISNSFDKFVKLALPHINDLIDRIDSFSLSLEDIIPVKTEEILEWFDDKLNDLLNTLESIDLSKVTNGFKKFIDILKDFLNVFKKSDGFITFSENFKEFLKNVSESLSISNLVENLNNIRDNLEKFIDWFSDKVAPFFSDFSFGSAVAAGSGIGIIYSMVTVAKSLKELTSSIKSVPDLLGGIKNTLEAYQKDLSATAIIKVAGAIGILAAALIALTFTDTEKLLEASTALSLAAGTLLFGVSSLLKVIDKGKGIPNALNTLSKGLSSAFKNFGKSMKIKAVGSALKDFGIAIAAISASIIGLAILYNTDKESLDGALKIVGVISGILVAIIGLMSFMGEKLKSGMKSFSTAALGILALSASLSMVISAMNKLFKMDFPSDWKTRLGILTGIFLGLATLSYVLSNVSKKSEGSKLSSGPILAVAAALYASVLALDKLFKMDLPSDWGKRFAILVGIFGAMGGLMIAMGYAGKLSGGAIKATGSILAVCAFVGVVTASLMILSIIPFDKLQTGAVALGALLIALGISLAGAGKISNASTYKSVLSMTAAVGAITASLGVLSMIPVKNLTKAVISLGSILLTMAINFNAISKINKKGVEKSVLSMVAATVTIAIALGVLANQPWDGMLAAGASLSATMLSFAEAYKIILKPNWSKNSISKIGTFLAMTLAVIPIGAALKAISNQPWDGMLAAGASLSGTIIAFSLAYQTILKPNWSKNSISKIGTFLAMTLAVIPIGAALAILANQPWDGMLAAGASLSETVLALSGAFAIISTVKPDLKSVGMFELAVIGLAGIAASLYFLADKPPDGLLAAAESLSLLLLSLSATFGICAGIGTIGIAAIAGIGILDLFIADLALIMVGFGELFTKIEGLEGVLDKGIEILIKIGEGLGRFAGSIISGMLQEISNSLPVIGDNLSKFMENGSAFFEKITSFGDNTFKNIESLSKSLLILTAAELIQGISSFPRVGGSLSNMGKDLSDFMSNALTFFEGVSELSPEVSNSISSLAKMILLLTAADILDGLSSWITGGIDLSEFGKELDEFAPYIVSFSEKVKGIDPSSVEGAASAAQIMSDMASKLPNSGGLSAKIFGDNKLSDFGRELGSFAPYIVSFSEKVKGIDPSSVEGAASAAQIMSDMASKLPNSGGLSAKIFGDNKLSDFGRELGMFAPYIKSYAEHVKGIDSDSVSGSANAAKSLADLAKLIPNSGGLVSFFAGNNDIGEFGLGLQKFGKAMKDYSDSVKNLPIQKLNSVVEEVRNLIAMANEATITDMSGVTELGEGLAVMAENGITAFMDEFLGSNQKVKQVIDKFISYAIDALKNKENGFRDRGIGAVTSYLNGINSQSNAASGSGASLVSSVINGLVGKDGEFINAGSISGSNYVNGINSQGPAAAESGSNLASNAVNGVGSKAGGFVEAGKNAGLGFARGLASTINTVIQTAKDLADAALKANKNKLKEKSPSKEFEQNGYYGGAGLAIGLESATSMVEEASSNLGDTAIKSAKNAIDEVTNAFDFEFQNEPIISPIVDLDNIRQSALDIQKLFGEAMHTSMADTSFIDGNIKSTNMSNITNESGNQPINDQRAPISFIQNNYSPKALSQIEIYRQTNNQISRLGKVVGKKP